MFRENTNHLQRSFFDIERQLSESKRKKIRESEEYNFYRLIFKKIKEENFFQNRILNHFVKTGENLLESVFDGLTEEHLKQLKIKTDIKEVGLVYGYVKYP